MKKRKSSITFFSFFPAVALLATHLLFSTLAPASSDDYIAPIDSSTWNIPQSQLVLEEFLRAQDVKNGEIEEVKFLDYGDSIYGGGENASSLISSSPAILDSGEIDTAYVLQNPEFQRQVEEVSAQAEKAGAAMPPLLTLVALFAFAIATGTSSLKDFFKFSTYTEKVKKTIHVTKKVAKTVYKTITETVARKVKTVKTVAYTAYETVRNVAYNTRTWVTEVVKYRYLNQIEKTEKMFALFEKYKTTISGKGLNRLGFSIKWLKLRCQDLGNSPLEQEYRNLQEEIGNQLVGAVLDTVPYGTEMGAKLREERDNAIKVKYFEKTTHSETTNPVVTYTQKPYTAYRDEVETKTVYDTIYREVPETIYEDVIENHEVVEDVTKYSFTPLSEKIGLAMSYLKNYSRILQTPSNRNFLDSALLPNRDLSLFAGAYEMYGKLSTELQTANIHNMDKIDPEGVKEILKRHNEFIYSMKGILTKIQKGKTPEEQMAILFGKDYTDSVTANGNAIAEAEADEKALTARFNEIEEMLRTNRISVGYYRSLYSSAKRNRDQLYRRQRDAEKNLKKSKEYYASRFNGTVSSLQNLSFLRSLEDWRRTLSSGESSISSRLVPFTTANGSTVYRKPATTATVAQPKKTLPKTQPAPANLQTAGPLGWLKNRKQQKIEAKKAEQKRELLEYDRAKAEAVKAETEARRIAKQKSVAKTANTNLHPDELTNTILTSVAQNFPLENPSQRYLYLGSGYHDGNEYYSVDLNHVDGGDSDRGHPVKAVSSGIVRIANYVNLDVDLKHGAVTIDHQEEIDKENVSWQSGYLHMPLFATGVKEKVDVLVDGKVTQEEREIYEVRNTKKIKNEKGEEETIAETVKLWDGKNVATGEQIGFVGGRQGVKKDGSYNEMIGNAHLHFFAKMNDKAVDLRTALFEAGLRTVKAYDGGPDGSWTAWDDNVALNVQWDGGIQSWVNETEKLVLDRRPQEANTTGSGLAQHWLAWEEGVPVEKMQKVVWDKTKYIDEAGNLQDQKIWVQSSDKSLRWNGEKFLPTFPQ